ncbi:MAG: pyroglutamyl-peptidase I [Oscillospiraceae bacterium]|nr:pyroglutamyl-peptidase I [Oscillospiraceae bacterium]
MKILVTGFQPFGKETKNPSYEAVKLLPNEILGAKIVKLEVPVVFGLSGEVVAQKIREEQPDIVICVGQAGGRTAINPERVGINVNDGATPDNEGYVPSGEAIVKDGPDAYFSTLPIKAMVQKMVENDIPASVSNTAGTYVCNHLMYSVLHLLHQEFPAVRGGFIHVPYATMQGNFRFASMPLSEIAKGLELSIEACIENEQDITASHGATH